MLKNKYTKLQNAITLNVKLKGNGSSPVHFYKKATCGTKKCIPITYFNIIYHTTHWCFMGQNIDDPQTTLKMHTYFLI